jgi:DNA (cytosine-5)-methyltransferase 1
MSSLRGEVSEVIDLFPGAISRIIPFSECSTSDTEVLEGDDLKRWQYIPQGGNFENLPQRLRTSAKFSNAYRKLALSKPSYTLPKTDGNLTTGAFFHPVQPRRINQLEKTRIGGFPKCYQFTGDEKTIAARIGNSVPPLLMKAIAIQIRHKLWNGEPLTRYPKSMTYPEILEAAWQDHLKPKDPDAPTVISTFAGGGGSSLGYSMAGYRELLAVEWDNNAVETFKLNFPDVPVYHGDIAKLSVKECMGLAGLSEPGELDLFDGSPPCQGFSSAGKRILNDPRNQLFREYVRLLRGLKPKVFVMENVPGLVKGKMKLVFAEIMRELKASGYQVRCKKLNAMYFYVPQSRERLIFIGIRDDLTKEISFPKAESRAISVKDALKGVNTTNNLTPEQKKWWGKLKPGQSASALHPKGHWFNFLKLSPLQISPTIPKESGNAKFSYWDRAKGLSIDGYKRIGSFPDTFKFRGGYGKEKNRIGNSVPPLFMRTIAEHIKINILA